MQIIKQFEDKDFFERYYYLALEKEELENGYWFWGLDSDGDLCCKCSDFLDPDSWYHYNELSFYKTNIKDMRKIVKEFGHLLVFI